MVTVKGESFTQRDESLLKEVPENLPVIKTDVFEPFNMYRSFLGKKKDAPLVASETISKENKGLRHRLAVWVRMNLFIPDARVGWYPYGVKAGKRILKEEAFDAVATLGPPHSTHLIGRKLSRKFNIPHYPILIDPWVDIIYYKGFNRSRLTKKLDNRFERKVMEGARQIVFVTKSAEEDYLVKYPAIKGKTNVLYWGYDERFFKDVKRVNSGTDTKVILHAGNIFDYQNPRPFWKRVKERIDQGEKYAIRFIGTVGPGVKNFLKEIGLESFTEYLGFLPYPKAVEQMLSADYLLVCATEKRHVPGKLFEYLRTGNKIIAFGDDNREVNDILKRANAGMLFPYDNNAESFFMQAGSFKTDLDYVSRFDREAIAKEFSGVLNK